MSQEYKIQLGIDFNDGELKNIKKQLTGLTNDTHRIRIDIDNSRLLKQVAHAKRELRGLNDLGGSKGNSPTLKMDTESVENALNRVANSIDEIRASLNTLDGKSGMQSLVASVNQIASALGKATDESETLIKTLSALGKKDFSFNIDLKLGGGSNSFSNTAAYGDYVRRTAVPELRKQAESMMKAIREQYKDEFFSWQSDEYILDTLSRRKSYTPARSVGIIQKEMLDGRNLSKQMAAHSEFISLLEEIGNFSGVDMSSVSSGFTRTKDEIIQNAFDIQSGVKTATEGVEESAKKLKNIFGTSIDADSLSAQLTPIVEKLEEIRIALNNLSNADSLGGLTVSFDKLSGTLETLLANAKQVQDVLGAGGINTDVSTGAQESANAVVKAEERKQQAIKETRRLISDSAQSAIDAVTSKSIDTAFEVDKSDSDAFRREMENLVSQWTNAKGKLSDIKIGTESFYDKDANRYIEKITRAQVTYNNELGETIKKNIALRKIGEEQTGVKYDKKTKKNVPVYEPIYGFVETTGQYSKSLGKTKTQTDAFIKQQKQAVASLTNQINQMNRAAADQNAARPIKLESHLTSLADKYNEITSAIQRMESASSDTFVDEQNNVKKLISEFKSLVSEYKNAENVSTKMKGTDFASGLKIATNDLEKFKAEAKGFSVDMSKLDIGSVVDASSLNNFNDKLRIARSELAKVKSETAAANRNEKVGINVSGLQSKIADLQRISPEINEFETNVKGAEVTVESLLNDLGRVKTQGDFSVVNSKFRAFSDAAKAAGIAVSETASKTKNELAKQIKIDLKTGEFKTQISSIEQDAKKLSGAYREIDGSITRLNQALSNMKTAAAQGDVDGLIKSYKEYEATLKAVENQIDQNRMAEKNATDLTKLNQKKQSLSLEMKNWLKDNSAAAQDFGARIRELQMQIDACDDSSLGNLRREFQNIKKEAQLAGKTTKTVGDRIKEQFAQYSTYLGVAEMFMWAEQGLRDMFEQVKLIDSAMTELKKVTNETDATYNKFLTNAGSRAKEIGTTVDGLVNSTADFARLGYEFADAQGLAEVANIYAVVGDDIDSVETATQSLISTLTAFKNEAGDLSDSDFALSIVDKMNEVSNNFAISSGGLGDALQRSASSMMAANNSLDETIALITAANTVVQDPDSVGTAFKTISMRMKIHCPQ